MLQQVGIVVINWNGAAQTRRCLGSLLALDHTSYRIAVIDNGSTDGSADELDREFSQLEIVRTGRNLGYAGACNVGMRWAREAGVRYVWMLNNDTLADPSALTELVRTAETVNGPAIVAPEILVGGGEGRIWSAGGLLKWPWLNREHIGLGLPAGSFDRAREVQWASGCSLFLSQESAAIAGPMDERYFLYLEDVDWCLTAGKRGVRTYFAPRARIWHAVSESTKRLDPRIARYYACRNYFMLAFRHGGVVGRAWAAGRLALTLAKTCVRSAVSRRHRHDSYYHAQTRALLDVLRRRGGPAPYSHDPVDVAAQRSLETVFAQ